MKTNRNILLGGLLLLLYAVLSAGCSRSSPASGTPAPIADNTITASLNASTKRPIGPFYGANGQLRNSENWFQSSNPGFASALQDLAYGILRIPSGQGGNYWDYNTGDFVTGYGKLTNSGNAPSPYPSPLSELQTELGYVSQGDYVVNALTDPTCSSGCSFSSTPPNESSQLEALSTISADGMNVKYIELGNEYYLGFSDYTSVYPSVSDYVTLANKWIADIKAAHPGLKVAVVGASCWGCSTPRRSGWNKGLMSGLTGADAVTLHVYTASGLTVPVNNDNAATMLLTPFTNWDNINNDDIPSLTTSSYSPNIWFTEFNLSDTAHQNNGTWAHGLFQATNDLLFVTNPRVTMALHHEVQDPNEEFPDIFSINNGFSNYNLSVPITTTVYGYTAQGLTTREIDKAALNQTSAEALTFSGAPTFDSTHPKIIGEIFTGASANQMVILNLDSVAHTVDLSSVLSSGSYRQISGEAGSYIDGKVISGGFEGYDDSTGAAANLTLTSGTLSPSSQILPAFSITRIW